MKVTLEMFGNDKDNYYNFKQNYLKASESIHLSFIYIHPEYRNTNLVELNEYVNNLRHNFTLEFED